MTEMRSGLMGALAFVAMTGATGEVLAQHKYALQLFHFNLQYVCGGTIGYTPNPNPEIDLDNDTIEDRIITESFAPIVELFEQHPSWGVDLEMQAYMLDVIAWRHPELLDKMRTMADTGQIDIVSFHYSDQLFIGYPAEDWERSQALTADTFDRHGVKLSRTVFCQEGQGASAMQQRMSERGYRNMVWPKNLWTFQHGDAEALPLYQFGDVFMMQGGKGFSFDDGVGTTIDVTWTFLDDGELLATGDVNPYFPEVFFVKPEEVAAYEQRLSDLEAQGYLITTVDKYVEAAQALVTPTPAPPLLDGTWQPNSTNGVARWLGGRGLFWQQERDNHVRTVGAQAHRELVAAELIATEAGLDARAELDAAWRMLFLGQVTDASGINPFAGEIQYGLAHMGEAMAKARAVIRDGKASLGIDSAAIDPLAGSVEESRASTFSGSQSDAPLELLIDGGDREVSEHWEEIGDGHWRVTIDFGLGEFSTISVTFPGELEDRFDVGLALDDTTPFSVERSAFSFETFHFALPTGYIGLGGGRFVIKDMGQVHLAAAVAREEPGVSFVDETASIEDTVRWVFHLFDGSAEDAAEQAIAINAKRRLVR